MGQKKKKRSAHRTDDPNCFSNIYNGKSHMFRIIYSGIFEFSFRKYLSLGFLIHQLLKIKYNCERFDIMFEQCI